MYKRKDLQNVTKLLRSKQTPWEAKLWSYLRANRLNRVKLKRQVPIGQYVVDFCCHQKRLIIELDGGHHDTMDTKRNDNIRQGYLQYLGYKVLRFWNNDIDSNIEGVYELIQRALA